MSKSNIYFTSDTHFNHANIIEYCPDSRGHFSSVEDMNESIIEYWNLTIPPNATVYHLGDLDHSKRRKEYTKCGVEIKDIDYISYKGKYFILSHFAIGNPECMAHLIGENSEVWNLHGHTHQYDYFSTTPNTFHVGLDSNNMKPISIDKVWELINNQEA